ncbi:Uncharacterised protein [Bordetella pertussis]|nr:Uncharacterised protein [Bordetella pertussis]CFW18522.1 Uncharacterised protein [Bordetella pertussis]CFW48691.1 Uncharacterised protein [Bordetella pertussis]CPN59550.1 Uncharacterised protein [Bordetella pertussis]
MMVSRVSCAASVSLLSLSRLVENSPSRAAKAALACPAFTFFSCR